MSLTVYEGPVASLNGALRRVAETAIDMVVAWQRASGEVLDEEVRFIHNQVRAAVDHRDHRLGVLAILALSIAECEQAIDRAADHSTLLQLRHAIQRLLNGCQILRPEEAPVKRARKGPPLQLPPLTTTRLQPSEFLLLDTVLPNSAVNHAVWNLRRGRYHPNVCLYNVEDDVVWSDREDHGCLYFTDIIFAELEVHLTDGTHAFSFLHILARMKLLPIADPIGTAVRLDQSFAALLQRSPYTRVLSSVSAVPVFPTIDWKLRCTYPWEKKVHLSSRRPLVAFHPSSYHNRQGCPSSRFDRGNHHQSRISSLYTHVHCSPGRCAVCIRIAA